MGTKQAKATDASSDWKLPGVGKQIAKHLARIGIFTIEDLLFHLPTRYQDRTQIRSIRSLKPGEEAVIEGVIKTVSAQRRGRTKLLCELQDQSGKLTLRFFHVLPFQLEMLKPGTKLLVRRPSRMPF